MRFVHLILIPLLASLFYSDNEYLYNITIGLTWMVIMLGLVCACTELPKKPLWLIRVYGFFDAVICLMLFTHGWFFAGSMMSVAYIAIGFKQLETPKKAEVPNE